MDTLDLGGRTFHVDRATRGDVRAIVALLRDDPIGAEREIGTEEDYLTAFDRVDADPANTLVAVRDPAGDVVATLQLTVIPGLSRAGTTRVLVEAVRVSAPERGSGLGRALLTWVAGWARAHGAGLVQLTTSSERTAARAFYERQGYVASHVGMKLDLSNPGG